MTIRLTPEQLEWLQAHVANGDFPSVERAAQQMIDERIAEHELAAGDDLAWAKPYVEEGLAALRRGELVSFEEYKARNAALLASLKS
jgi:antitoxin ParD1/3/4